LTGRVISSTFDPFVNSVEVDYQRDGLTFGTIQRVTVVNPMPSFEMTVRLTGSLPSLS
jgi:hypothetical protein